jgi:hypothetical protein
MVNATLAFGYQEPRGTLFETRYASPTPPWATDPSEFQKSMGTEAYEYLDAVLTEFADDFRYWEIGNEMFHWQAADPPILDLASTEIPDSYPLDGYSPIEQAAFIHDAADFIAANDSDALVVLPSIVVGADNSSVDWLEEVVGSEGSSWFDVVTYHGYRSWSDERSERIAFEAVLETLGLQDKLIQLTETGASALASNTQNTDYPNSPAEQCADVFRRLVIGWAAGDSSVIWHSYKDLDGSDEAGGFEGYGLFAANETARPSAYTMQLMTSEVLPLLSATDTSDTTADVYRYRLVSTDGSVHWVIWGSGTYTVPTDMTQYTSVYPNSDGSFTWTTVSAGSSFTLSSVPVLFR